MRKDFYFRKSWIYINIVNPLKTWSSVKEVFKFPKVNILCGSNVKTGNILIDYKYPHRKILNINCQDIGYKMKWDDPRHEHNPYICIDIFNKFRFIIEFKSPTDLMDDFMYWEIILEYILLYNKNIKITQESFGWCKYIIDNEGNRIAIPYWTDKILTEKGKQLLYGTEDN